MFTKYFILARHSLAAAKSPVPKTDMHSRNRLFPSTILYLIWNKLLLHLRSCSNWLQKSSFVTWRLYFSQTLHLPKLVLCSSCRVVVSPAAAASSMLSRTAHIPSRNSGASIRVSFSSIVSPFNSSYTHNRTHTLRIQHMQLKYTDMLYIHSQ